MGLMIVKDTYCHAPTLESSPWHLISLLQLFVGTCLFHRTSFFLRYACPVRVWSCLFRCVANRTSFSFGFPLITALSLQPSSLALFHSTPLSLSLSQFFTIMVRPRLALSILWDGHLAIAVTEHTLCAHGGGTGAACIFDTRKAVIVLGPPVQLPGHHSDA